MQVDCKVITDSVHGNIKVEKKFFSLIDTPEFQRLRRLEQSPIRSIFPCAHHDRFVHSLGVFHIGNLILEKLHSEAATSIYYNTGREYEVIERSYQVACLLHDIGHAPFSHTFERYYGKREELCKRIVELVNDNEFQKDIETDYKYASEHEYLSAIIVMSKGISETIEKLGADSKLVVRMILGRKYKTKLYKKDVVKQIRNCYITLLNGGVIDADRLDYACRDVWASGYATSTIDMERLVAGIHIAKNNATSLYEVCFSINVLNEIKSLVAVKDFQVQYVINHHVVLYDLDLLERAANEMAKAYYYKNTEELPLSYIISEKSLKKDINRLTTYERQLNLQLLSDDDIIVLIKGCLINQEENRYYKEWKSRSYEMFPLWKTKDEFFYYYSMLLPINKYLSEDRLKPLISEKLMVRFPKLFTDKEDIRIISCDFKSPLSLDNLNLLVCNNVVKYSDIPQQRSNINSGYKFYYIYISNDCIQRYEETINKNKGAINKKNEAKELVKEEVRQSCINELRPIFEKVYYSKDDTCFNLVLEHMKIDETSKYITIDCHLNNASGNNYTHFFGTIVDEQFELTTKGEKTIEILKNILIKKLIDDFIGFDVYVNRIRLYFTVQRDCFKYADKILEMLNSEFSVSSKQKEKVKLIRE